MFTPPPQSCDSGSLLINSDTSNAIGLVLAATADGMHGLAIQILSVLNALEVNLAVNANHPPQNKILEQYSDKDLITC